MKYDPKVIEPKWQKKWQEKKAFKTPTDLDELKKKPKYYVLDMFPYPSGSGLHVGHPEGYTATDIVARYKRAKGFHVLHPMGWDAFGLPAERAAIREKSHPAVITKRNVENFRRQIDRLGFSYDWDREINTSSAEYYRWTQWIFLKLYEKGLAYAAEVPVNWCPALGTVLANEEVKEGKYVETGDPVERRLLRQWLLKIPVYAERLLEDLETLDWPEPVKEMQRNWIGKSEGAEFDFQVDGKAETFRVFTTRPDTLFGATYCVLAPEHPILKKIVSEEQKAQVEEYVQTSAQKNDLARTDLATEKTGVFSGAYAIHPITQKKIPIWVADYVLMTYGTGAIMAVPAHDERDHEFAKKFDLSIIEVVSGGKDVQKEAFLEDGTLVNSDFLNGLSVPEAKKKMISFLEEKKIGVKKVQYRLRDWLFSRQRYWGEPFPLVELESGEILPISEEDLPILLPEIQEFKPTEDGRPPLARADSNWLKVKLPDGRTATRETNTMPQWAGSCWYYLRFIDSKNQKEPWSKELENYWMPVDLYIGGVEHAVLHLLYSRFWHKVLYDCGLVSTKEPFQGLFNQGMILSNSFQDQNGKYHHPSKVKSAGKNQYVLKESGESLSVQVEKMSKSKNNVVNPDDVIDEFGADSLRLYEMFMGPLDAAKLWQTESIDGLKRFLSRTWRLVVQEQDGSLSEKLSNDPPESQEKLWKLLHQTIKKVSENTESLKMNTAISQMMIFVNEATQASSLPREIVLTFLKVLAPYAPHLAEELWSRLGQKDLICFESWPDYEESLCVEEEVTIVVMVNGKKRSEFKAAKDSEEASLKEKALSDEKVQKHIAGKTPKKIIVVPNKLVNIVA